MPPRARRAALLSAIAGALAASGCTGSVEIEAVLAEEAEPFLDRVTRLEALAEGPANGRATTFRGGLRDLELPDLAPGPWVFTVTAYDEEGLRLLQGRTPPLEVERGRELRARLLLGPVESFVALPASGSGAADEVAAREAPTATRIVDGEGRDAVLLTGGLLGGEPSAETFLFRPDLLRFEAGADMACPRAGHGAVPAAGSRGAALVVVAGGGVSACAEPNDRETAATLIEALDLSTLRFEPLRVSWERAPGDEGAGPPDLAEATLTAAPNGAVVVAAEGRAWLLDATSSGPATALPLIDGFGDEGEPYGWDPPLLAEEVVATLDGSEPVVGAALVSADHAGTFAYVDGLSACPAPEGFAGPSGPMALTRAPFAGLLVTSADEAWSLGSVSCFQLGRVVRARLDEEPGDHLALGLKDGRTLLLGGADGRRATVLLPAQGSDGLALVHYPGPESLHGHQGRSAAPLPGGGALLAGGGAEAELWNPARGQGVEAAFAAGTFEETRRPTTGDVLRVVFIVDGTPAAEGLRGRFGHRAASMVPERTAAEGGSTGIDVRVGVIGTDAGDGLFDAGCGEAVDPPWVRVDDTGPALLDTADVDAAGLLTLRVERAGVPPRDRPRCPVSQPLRVVSRILDQLDPSSEGGDYAAAIGAEPGALLLVVVAAGDDCSAPPGSGGPPLPWDGAACGEAGEGLVDPEELASRLAGQPVPDLRVEVAVLPGSLDGDGSCAAGPRLARLVEALGGAGLSAAACEREEDAAVSAVAIRSRFLGRRRACVPTSPAAPRRACRLFSVARQDETEESTRLAEGADWRRVPDALECRGPDDDGADLLALEVSVEAPRDLFFLHHGFVCY